MSSATDQFVLVQRPVPGRQRVRLIALMPTGMFR